MLRFKWLVLVVLACVGSVRAAEPFLWIEGESGTNQQHIVANPGLNNFNPYALSGGEWISSFSEANMPDTGTVDYVINIETAGDYHLWLRAGGTGISYRWDGGAWDAYDLNKGINSVPAAADGNLWPPPMSWHDRGIVKLTADKHTLTIMLGGDHPGKGRFAALDCLVLTTGEFTPHGKYKPGEKLPEPMCELPEGKGWDFVPPVDALDSNAVLDLRYLNEKEAGSHGFIQPSKDGNSFVAADGTPMRFWGGSEYAQRNMNLEQLKHFAQFLAKRGINIVRVHTALEPKTAGSKVTDIDEKQLDEVFKLVAAMKTAGIYTVISPFWGTSATIQASWGTMAKAGGRAEPLLFIDPVLQTGYKAWVKELYTRPNPYNGIKLADEPAVAIIQLQNENSLLFWTMGGLQGTPEMEHFRIMFADFLKKKYGSLDKARAAWKDYNPAGGDLWIHADWDKGLPPFSHPWDFTRDGLKKKGAIPGFIEFTADCLEFMATTMRDFNADMINYLRHDLGCKQMVNPGNWQGVDPLTEQDAEYWTNTAGEVIGRNFYAGGLHVGPNNGWQIIPGHFYDNISFIKEPTKLPINLKQVEGKSLIIPETLWVPPSVYESEGAPLVAAQTALTGLNIAFWFADSQPWDLEPAHIWTFATPMAQGQFPAAALMFRTGLVAEGKPVVIEQRNMTDLWQRKTPMIAEASSHDPNHDGGNAPVNSPVETMVDPLAFMVGPVRQVFGGDPAKNYMADFSKYIDRDKKLVKSVTGELETDYGKGIYRINAPKAQGALGFLGGNGVQQLADVAIACNNNYASIVVVPLDDKPIKESSKVLIQVGTISRNKGWLATPDQLFIDKKPAPCYRIVSVGKGPMQIEKTDTTVTITNPGFSKAQALDANGMPMAEAVDMKQAGGQCSITLPPDTLYVVVSK